MDNLYNAPRLTEEEIISIVERNNPNLAEACKTDTANKIVMTQAAFAEDYLIGEFTFWGLCMKYAGIKGKEVIIIPHTK